MHLVDSIINIVLIKSLKYCYNRFHIKNLLTGIIKMPKIKCRHNV